MDEILGRLPTIPEYYQRFIDKKVDLLWEPKQCCPFHKEDTPSFSYSVERDVWRCFGACKFGGDVVALHQKNYHLKSREEALRSLRSLFRVPEPKPRIVVDMFVDENNVRRNSWYAKACVLADRPERWLELDYVMSVYPLDEGNLQALVDRWTGGQNEQDEIGNRGQSSVPVSGQDDGG